MKVKLSNIIYTVNYKHQCYLFLGSIQIFTLRNSQRASEYILDFFSQKMQTAANRGKYLASHITITHIIKKNYLCITDVLVCWVRKWIKYRKKIREQTVETNPSADDYHVKFSTGTYNYPQFM